MLIDRTITATEARVHLGEMLRGLSQGRGPILIERAGRAEAVLMSVGDYERLRQLEITGRLQALQAVTQFGAAILARRGGVPLTPPPEDVIREGREERDRELGLP